jgi:hypothetical protein
MVDAHNRVVSMPLNCYLKPEQVAHLFSWFTNEESTHVCGQTMLIDGGHVPSSGV